MREIHANDLHVKLTHPGEDSMRATVKHLQYSVSGTLEVCKDCDTAENKQKSIHKVVEERAGKMISLDLISQKKPSYRGFNNWILILDSDTNKNGISSQWQDNI